MTLFSLLNSGSLPSKWIEKPQTNCQSDWKEFTSSWSLRVDRVETTNLVHIICYLCITTH